MKSIWIYIICTMALIHSCKKDPVLTASEPEASSLFSTQSGCYITCLLDTPYENHGFMIEYDSNYMAVKSEFRINNLGSDNYKHEYFYDAKGRVIEDHIDYTNYYGEEFSYIYYYNYDSRDLIVRIDRSNSNYSELSYDGQNRLISYKDYKSKVLNYECRYTYDQLGNMIKSRIFDSHPNAADSIVTTFKYDSKVNPFQFIDVPINLPLRNGEDPLINAYSKNNIIRSYRIYFHQVIIDTTITDYHHVYDHRKLPVILDCDYGVMKIDYICK